MPGGSLVSLVYYVWGALFCFKVIRLKSHSRVTRALGKPVGRFMRTPRHSAVMADAPAVAGAPHPSRPRCDQCTCHSKVYIMRRRERRLVSASARLRQFQPHLKLELTIRR